MKPQPANPYVYVLIGIVYLLPTLSFAQEYNTNISNISVKNGLSQNTIQDILEDDNGFLWVGTQDGLNKYDGYSFKVYKSDPEDSTSIPNNFIKDIAKDKDGNLWICTQNGLAKYLYKKDRFLRISTGSSAANTILINDETILVGTNSGVVKADQLTNPDFRLIEAAEGKAPVMSMELDKNGKIWMGSDDGLCVYIPNQEKLLMLDITRGIAIKSISILNDKLWIASDQGLFSLNPDSVNTSGSIATDPRVNFYEMPGRDYHAISVFKDHMNTIWTGTQTRGVFTVDETKSILVESNFRSELFKYSSINKIYEDYTQCLWIGTVEAGLYKINISNHNFRLLRTQETDPNGLTSNIVRGLLKIDHRLWIASSRGLNLYDRKTNKNRRFTYDENNPNSISSNDVKVMAYSPDGAVWVGTDNGLNRLTPGSGNFERYFAEGRDPIIFNNRIRTVKTLEDGSLWVGSLGGGISVIHAENRKLIKSYNTENGGIGDDNVMNVFQSNSGEIFAASYGDGLFKLNEDVFEKVLPDSDLPNLLTSIHQSEDGLLWVGSYGDGYYSLDPINNQYQKYTVDDGLSNNVVYAAIPDKNAVWISTNYGLNRYDRINNSFLSFNENDGIQSNEFNTNSFYQCYTGELFFGGVNGLTFFYPDSIAYNSKKPKPAFTQLKIFNEPVFPDRVVMKGRPPLEEIVCDSSSVALAYYHSSFSIEFASLVYSNPEDSRYAYRLNGFDEDWVFTDANKRDVTYTNLNPGSYTFQMKASNGDGVWNDQPITLFIKIEPSIWQSLWFRISGILLGVSLLALMMYRRINKVERRKKFLEMKIKQHTKEISEQNQLLQESELHLINENKKKDQVFYILSHNVRAPLTTLVALLKNSNQLTDSDFESFISDSSQQVSESLLLLDNAFYWSLIQFDKLDTHVETFDLASLIRENMQKFDKTSSKHDVSIHFSNDSEQVAADRRILSLIIQNLLFNSIKFSKPGTEIQVSISYQKSSIQISITYYGDRMSKDQINELFDENADIHEIKSQNQKGVALGLIVSYKLARHLSYKLEIEKREEQCLLLLEMPIQ